MLCNCVVVLETQMLKQCSCQNQSTLVMKSGGFQLPGLLLSELLCLSVCERTVQVTFVRRCSTFSIAVQLQKSQVLSSLKLCHACLWRWLAIPGSLCYVIFFEIFFWWPRWHVCQIDTWQLQSDWLIEHAPSYANAIHRPVTVLQRLWEQQHERFSLREKYMAGQPVKIQALFWLQWFQKNLSTTTTLKLAEAGFTFVNISRSLPTMCWCFESTKLHATT